MDYKKLADLLYGDIKYEPSFWLNKYPKRNLPDSAEVMRIAPSPTGYLHTGHAYSAFISRATTRQTKGVFYFRLEDTDQKRLIENAGTIAYDMLCYYDMKPDEGYTGDGREQIGIYGDYIQSNRLDIYKTFAKYLVSIGRAFPCFCSKNEGKEDVLVRREEQLEKEETIIDHDVCRDLTYEEIEQNIKENKPFALRLLSNGDSEKTFEFTDLIKGKRQIRENTKDIVIMKSNGIPPYCFAHAVDDTLMGTTIVVRGEEWFPSLSAHLEIFKALGFNAPRYAHTPVICKLDEQGNKRKLSKRKDPEADVRYFIEQGYPVVSIMEYLLNLLNSDFEQWREKNPMQSYKEFNFKIDKIGSNNPMFDFDKLNDVSKKHISKLTKDEVYEQLKIWAKSYNSDFYEKLTKDENYSTNVLNIDRENPKPRRDIAKWSEVPIYFDYMFDSFNPTKNDYEIEDIDLNKLKLVCAKYAEIYNKQDDKQSWFENIKQMASTLGYAVDNKLYKQNPQDYEGNVADVCSYIRIAITKKKNSPDLYSILQLLPDNEIKNRLKIICSL